MGILVIALSINPRPLSALELTLSGLIMGSRVDTAGDNQNPHVIISKYQCDNPIIPPYHFNILRFALFETVKLFSYLNILRTLSFI